MVIIFESLMSSSPHNWMSSGSVLDGLLHTRHLPRTAEDRIVGVVGEVTQSQLAASPGRVLGLAQCRLLLRSRLALEPVLAALPIQLAPVNDGHGRAAALNMRIKWLVQVVLAAIHDKASDTIMD